MASTASVIPEGHSFLNLETLISTKAKDIAQKLLEQANNRCPDYFDMYIYNRYFAFGVIELVDKTLSTLHGKIKKKDFVEAFYLLEALVAFNDCESVWTQCNEGGRVNVTNRALEACSIAVFRGLNDADMLNAEAFPSLETVLKLGAEFNDMMNGQGDEKSQYGLFCKAIARRLFKDRVQKEHFATEMKRLEEWVNGLDDGDDKEELGKDLKKMAKKKASKKPWFATGKVCEEDYNASSSKLYRPWKDYKDYLQECPRMPLRGPPEWDLTQWTAEERKPFSFKEMDLNS